MLKEIAIILIMIWLLGLVTANSMDGSIHVLLFIAVVMILLRIVQGRRIL